jgi:hypothetical protein
MFVAAAMRTRAGSGREPVGLEHLRAVAEGLFGDLVKAVVDVDRGIMAIAGELHADEEALVLDDGSTQASLWESTCIRPSTERPAGSMPRAL